MKVDNTEIEGLLVITPKIYEDSRGYFFESFSKRAFKEMNLEIEFLQDNEAQSSRGVIRGLHFQRDPFAQAKLVRVATGKVWDVAVDLRKNSPTFGKSFGIELSAKNKKQLLIPRGFAHGYSVLEDHTIFVYKCDQLYYPEMDSGIHPLDQTLKIDWKLSNSEMIISEKDLRLPNFNYFEQ